MRIAALSLILLAIVATNACKPRPAEATDSQVHVKAPPPKPASKAPAAPAGPQQAQGIKADQAQAPGEESQQALRFDMTQQGQAQTADTFDAWLEKQGVRVATGAPKTGRAAAADRTRKASAKNPVTTTRQ